jgi:hypothetical protein
MHQLCATLVLKVDSCTGATSSSTTYITSRRVQREVVVNLLP